MGELSALAGATAFELAEHFRSGRLRPSELASHLLDRIEASRADNIYITVTADRALSEARASDARHACGEPLSLLDGIPVAYKDLFDIAGTVTTAGSALMARSAPAEQDASAVSRLSAVGTVTLGKVNTSEFAYSGLGLNPHFGTPRNPQDPQTARSPGGSSSGSGAAVAAGLTCVAIGTDTGGSIRVPASFNGVVGLKTSTGAIDKCGMFPLSRTMDTIGPLARSVRDCALLFQVLVGNSSRPIEQRPLTDLVLLCPTNHVCDDLQAAVGANFEASLSALERVGVQVRREAVPSLSAMAELTEDHGNLVAAEAYAEYAEVVESERVAEIDRRVVHRILGGKRMSARDVLTIQRERRTLGEALAQQLNGAVLVTPTTPITAPTIAPLEANDELFHRVNALALRNVSLGNALDLCSLAMPNGKDSQGLPTSLMLTALHGDDVLLLSFGQAVERHLHLIEQSSGTLPGKTLIG